MNESNRNKGKSAIGADSDITELFNQQDIDLPAELDNRIRNLARAELKQGKPVIAQTKKLPTRYSPLFATAAVMVLAVALVPMLVKQSPTDVQLSEPTTVQETTSVAATDAARTQATPNALTVVESDTAQVTMEGSEESIEDAASFAEQESPEVMSSAQPSAMQSVEAVTSTGGSAGAAVDEINVGRDVSKVSNDLAETTLLVAPNAISTLSDQTRAISASSKQSKKSASTLGRADVDNEYRLNQQSWLVELNRMFETGEQRSFLMELALFKKQHPSVDLQKHLSVEALALDAESAVHEK